MSDALMATLLSGLLCVATVIADDGTPNANEGANDNRCCVPEGAMSVSGHYDMGLYTFEHTSWFETPTANLTKIGYCIALPKADDDPAWFHWPRAHNLRGYTSLRTGRLRAVIPIYYPPAPEPSSPETNLWYGARPDVTRAELFDFDFSDEPLMTIADYSEDSGSPNRLAAVLEDESMEWIGNPLPALRSTCEMSIPVPRSIIDDRFVDDFDILFADVVLAFESHTFRIEALSDELQWLYVYRWSNLAPQQVEIPSGEKIAQVALPNRVMTLLRDAASQPQRMGPEQAVAPPQFGIGPLLSAQPDQPMRFSAAYFHHRAPRVEVMNIQISDHARGLGRHGGRNSFVPAAAYIPNLEP